jgi:hypothetical protein
LQIQLMCRSTSSVQNWWQQRIWGCSNKINNQPAPAKFFA